MVKHNNVIPNAHFKKHWQEKAANEAKAKELIIQRQQGEHTEAKKEAKTLSAIDQEKHKADFEEKKQE